MRFVYYFFYEGMPEPQAYFRKPVDGGGYSDVMSGTLESEGRPVPDHPDYELWKAQVYSKKKCSFCYASLRGTLADLENHVQNNHPERVGGRS